MTDAVIVSTARSPIGRAFKGSLKDIRPDDLSAQAKAGLAANDARTTVSRGTVGRRPRRRRAACAAH